MNWIILARRLITDPVAIVFALIVGVFAAIGGMFYGKRIEAKEQEAAYAKELSDAYEKARKIETELGSKIVKVSDDYEKQIDLLEVNVANVNDELGRLRVPRPSARCLPTVTAPSGQPDAAAKSAAEWLGPSEINLDGVAAEIIKLGADLDEAYIKIAKLQELVREYENSGKLP